MYIQELPANQCRETGEWSHLFQLLEEAEEGVHAMGNQTSKLVVWTPECTSIIREHAWEHDTINEQTCVHVHVHAG